MKRILFSVVLSSLFLASSAHAFWRVTWTDNSTNEVSFRIDRSVAGAAYTQAGTVAANVVTFDDLTSTSGVQHCYKVVAVNAIGEAASSEQCGMAAAPAAPGLPQLLWVP